MSYFKLFELPETFVIDLNQLDERYRALQIQYHPDRSAHIDQTGQQKNLQYSTRINDAYRQLKDPILRAQHLLSLHGLDPYLDVTIQDHDFLLEQLAWREQLAELKEQTIDSRMAPHIEQFERLAKQTETEKEMLLSALEKSLEKEAWEESVAILHRLLFIQKFGNELDKLEEKLLF